MGDRQLDLFADAGVQVLAQPVRRAPPLRSLEEMDDAALIAAIVESSLDDSRLLSAEAGRRRLAAAVPALATLCRRFAGFGLHHPVPEQVAALESLAMIGSRAAAEAVVRMLERGIVQGPTLAVAVDAAARLRASLKSDVLRGLLRHPDPRVRANACRCARPSPEVVALLIDLLDDLDATVAKAAACALGQMGRTEARAALKRALREAPSTEAIEAVAPIADEECMVLLGRLARSAPTLADVVLDALDNIDHPRAATIAAAARRAAPPVLAAADQA
jgi:HEAT repeat protein